MPLRPLDWHWHPGAVVHAIVNAISINVMVTNIAVSITMETPIFVTMTLMEMALTMAWTTAPGCQCQSRGLGW